MTATYINHIALALDASISMTDLESTVTKVAIEQIEHLARRSRELGQQTRFSIYTFANDVRCEIFDHDVRDLPNLAGLYRVRGNRTALIDATIQSQQELATTSQLHGEHAFLTFVLTDGENNINNHRAGDLRQQLRQQPSHWTVACLVPDMRGKDNAQAFGFAPDNIAVWDATSRRGLEEAGGVMRVATDSFLDGRTRGQVGTRTLFSTGADAVNTATVSATLQPIDPSAYVVYPVDRDEDIRDFVARQSGRPLVIGTAYYQFVKKVTIQHHKKILVRDKKTGQVFGGDQARDLIGLDRHTDVRVEPDHNDRYSIFVQSTAPNRKVLGGTELLVMR